MVVFYIRASYRLLSLLFHDNRASHSQDIIWPWKFKVKGTIKVKGTPVSTASCWLIFLVFHIRASYRLPSPSFHDNRATDCRDTIWPWKFKVKVQGQRHPSQRSIQLTHFLSVSYQGILSTLLPFAPWQSGLPFPRNKLNMKIQGQRSRSKVP